MNFAYQTGEFAMPSGRLDTASLKIEQQWPRELIKFGIAVVIAAAIIVTLALAGQNDDGTTPTTAAMSEDINSLPAAIPEPEPIIPADQPIAVPAVATEDGTSKPPSLVTPKKKRKVRKRHKKRRSRKKRRRR